jgi:dimethylargininase
MDRPTAAIVRPVSPRLTEAEVTHVARRPVDVDRARAQHAAYCRLLAELDLEVLTAPAAPDHPDGVFVEDTVVVIGGLAVLTRPGAPSRRGEVTTVAPLLAARGLRTIEVTAPATLDGGDVLQVGETVFVGRSTRTSPAATAQLRALLTGLGRRVVPVDVSGALHLKTAVTALPDGTLLAVPDRVDVAALGGHVVTVPEPAGANVLVVGRTVVVPASAPATADLVADRGWPVRTIDVSEFERVEAGVTCLSVLLP